MLPPRGDEDEDGLDRLDARHMDSSGRAETVPSGEKGKFPDVAVYSKRRHFQASGSAHLVLPDHPHASAAAAVRGLEDDGEAVGLGKHLRLLQAGDGGVGPWDDRHA